jgi:transcriptional regulator with XRE-family HTH domain
MPTFAEVIADSGLSLSKVAEKAGFSATAFRNWRKGKVPRPKTRKKLEAFFGVNDITYGESDTKEKAQVSLKVRDHLNSKYRKHSELHQISGAEQFTLMQIIECIGFDEAMRRLVE